LKTEQVIQRLLTQKHAFKIFAMPFMARPGRKKPALLNHRPNQAEAVAPEVLAKKHEIPYLACAGDGDIDDSCDLYLLLGGGLISPEGLRGKKIINAHPGIIPACRGLDAFKWAVHDLKPLGVTLHYIDENVDAGEIIAVAPTHVYITDSLATLARRHYENEINCLANYQEHLDRPGNPYPELETSESKRRMPLEKESALAGRFENYLMRYGK
jgi:phosphoribosylglycinamide formyltransferase-1